MGAALEFEKEKLIIGVIYHDKEVLDEALRILIDEFGEVDLVSEEFSFSGEFSTYYDDELGGEGLRRIYSFKNTVAPDRQADIKIRTNEIEAAFSVDGKRKINLDPGFINHGRLMLATTKETGFRVPLKDGIYTELTLFYARGAWQKFPWTYRDYQSERVQRFITEVREIYLSERRENLSKSGKKQR
ncbi:MAG: DUF4416 family protein [Ruminococcaceae bacterium]|nr:DUF4416 family protein [Oscillospiraceae bacterium]